MDLLNSLIKSLNISDATIYDRALSKTPAGLRTESKELVGEAIIEKYGLLRQYFPECLKWYQVKDVDLQRAGVDYIVELIDSSKVNIDLKVCIGPDYSMKAEDFAADVESTDLGQPAIPVEIYQYGIFTNSEAKATNYMLYIVIDNKHGCRSYLIRYAKIMQLSKAHIARYSQYGEFQVKDQVGKYKWHNSYNNTGVYIKVPVFKYSCKEIPIEIVI